MDDNYDAYDLQDSDSYDLQGPPAVDENYDSYDLQGPPSDSDSYDLQGPINTLTGLPTEGGGSMANLFRGSLGSGVDKSLLSTVGSFFGNNKELTSMLLSGLGNAMKGESALQLYNKMRADKQADQQRYSDSVKNMKPMQTGLIGSSMIQNLRGQA